MKITQDLKNKKPIVDVYGVAKEYTDEDAEDEWTLARSLERENTFVSQLAPSLNLTEEQVDELFKLGATL